MPLIVLALSLSNCAYSLGSRAPKNVKVYVFYPDSSWCKQDWCQGKSGFVRSQAQEVIPVSKAKGMIAMTPDDFSRVLEACPK
jgi:hypothetical protein